MTARICIKLNRHLRRRLEREARKTCDALYRIRVSIVLHYDRGWGCVKIAGALGCAPSHAVCTARRYQDLGEEGLLDGRAENGIEKVDDDLLAALLEIVDCQPEDYGWSRSTWTRELLAKELARHTRVHLSRRSMGRALERIGARYGMARPLSHLAWAKTRKLRRARRILKIVDARPKTEPAFYVDELDVHLNPKIGRDWMLAGTQKGVVTPGKNRKRYVYGGLAVDGDDLVYTASDHKNSDGFIAFLERLRAAYPKAEKIHLILDNFIIHDSKKTQRYLAETGVFELHFLLPYSPEHNRIERLWRDLHGSVTRNHRCADMPALMRRVRGWLDREARRRRARAPARPAKRAAA